MPYPLIHLHVANNLIPYAEVLPGEIPAFFMGALAPDACHISEIPKRLTHFWDDARNSFSPGEFQSRFLAGETPSVSRKGRQISHFFALGYLCHLITDDLWLNTVARPLFHVRYPDKKLRATIYYQECDRVERELFRKANGDALLERIRSCPPVEIPGVVDWEAVDAWRRRVLRWDWLGAAASETSGTAPDVGAKVTAPPPTALPRSPQPPPPQTLTLRLVEEFIAEATVQNRKMFIPRR